MDSCAVVSRNDRKITGYVKWGLRNHFFARYMCREGLENVLVVQEAGAEDIETAEALLHYLRKTAARQNRSRILFTGPPDHLLSRAMYARGAQFRQAIVPHGGAQARFIRFHDCFRTLEHEFARRCTGAGLKSGTLRIRTGIGNVGIRLKQGRVTCSSLIRRVDITMEPRELIQHLFGTIKPPCMEKKKGRMLRALFPRDHACTWPHDEMI
jgi:hypothetical protein